MCCQLENRRGACCLSRSPEVLGQLTNRQQRQALTLAEPVSPHQPPFVLLSRLKLRQFVAVVLPRCAKIASIHIFSYGGPAIVATHEQLVARVLMLAASSASPPPRCPCGTGASAGKPPPESAPAMPSAPPP